MLGSLSLILLLGGTPLPAQDPARVPEASAILKEVIENLDHVQAGREDYTATKTVVNQELDDRGQVKKRDERTYHAFYLSGRRVEKLVAVNGRALSESMAKKEEQRIEKLIRDNQARLARGSAADSRAAAKPNDDDEPDAARILRLCRFVNGRRETFRGREVLVYDFEPRPEAKARGRVESWIKKLAGRIRVDEAARQMVRLEARVTDSLKVGGGLFFSVRKGSSMVLEQDLVKGEMWLPTYAEVHASARFLVLKGMTTHQTQTFSDYRKFAVDTTTQIRGPRT